MEVSAEVR